MEDQAESQRDPEPRVRLEPGFDETWPGASALATECIINVAILYDQTVAFGEALVRKHGIPSRGAFNVLAILHGAGAPLPPSVIADRMIVTRPTMTGLLATLERRALITRVAHPTDGRMALIDLTPWGRVCVDALRPALHQAEKQWVSCLNEAEQLLFLTMLARLQANALLP